MRPLTTKLTASRSRSERMSPDTRNEDLFICRLDDARGGDGVLRLEGGQQSFCSSSPSPASLSVENSRNIFSSCAPMTSIFGGVGDVQELRADVLHVVPQLAVGEAIRGEAVDEAKGVAELVVEDRAVDARGRGRRMSPTFCGPGTRRRGFLGPAPCP